MCDNAELWTYVDEKSQRNTIIVWLRNHHIIFNSDETLENLIKLYKDVECGKI